MAKESTTVAGFTGKSGVDLRGMRKLTRDLRGFKPSKELHKALRAAGLMIAEDAKEIAGEVSTSVPPTVKVRVSKTKISVVAGNEDVPLAGLLELGNKGKNRKQQTASSTGEFRHPVWGDRDEVEWVAQPMHPYLLKAAVKNYKNIESLEGAAVAKAFAERDLPVS
jgi:hypothetical protein